MNEKIIGSDSCSWQTYVLTQNDILEEGRIHTKIIQKVINFIAEEKEG